MPQTIEQVQRDADEIRRGLLKQLHDERVLFKQKLAAMENSMVDMLGDVRQFHITFGHPIADQPIIPPQNLRLFRRATLHEELKEFDEAWEQDDIAGMADALADLMYFIIGTALVYGIPLAIVWRAVQRANMAKVFHKDEVADYLSANPGYTARECSGGFVVYDQAGKVKKPPGWSPPDVKRIIDTAMNVDQQNANREAWNKRIAEHEAKRGMGSAPDPTSAPPEHREHGNKQSHFSTGDYDPCAEGDCR